MNKLEIKGVEWNYVRTNIKTSLHSIEASCTCGKNWISTSSSAINLGHFFETQSGVNLVCPNCNTQSSISRTEYQNL